LLTLSRVTHVLSAFFRREYPLAAGARPQFVDPRMSQNAKHPASQRGIGPQLMSACEGPFECELHQVIRVVRISRQGARKAAQPGQQ
jgi:hypothetical protein